MQSIRTSCCTLPCTTVWQRNRKEKNANYTRIIRRDHKSVADHCLSRFVGGKDLNLVRLDVSWPSCVGSTPTLTKQQHSRLSQSSHKLCSFLMLFVLSILCRRTLAESRINRLVRPDSITLFRIDRLRHCKATRTLELIASASPSFVQFDLIQLQAVRLD
jgi:hypothetical protein